MRTAIDFSSLWRHAIGFDYIVDQLMAAKEAVYSEYYPPYNVERSGEGNYRISIAVAGFSEDEISVTAQPNLLTVVGDKVTQEASELLYQGFAGPSFRRQFRLADHIKMQRAHLKNGLLTIDLVRDLPEAMRRQRIEIATGVETSKVQPMQDEKAA